MKLTLGQVQGALGLSRDAYRHWQTVLLPLGLRRGHKPCFTHSDLLALAIVKFLTDEIEVPVSKLDPTARALFEMCEQQSWARLERSSALIQPGDWSVSFVAEGQPFPAKRAGIIVPCAPIIAALRTALTIEQPEDVQTALRFPLASVTPNRGRQQT